MNSKTIPTLTIIAGPNGAGKTTFVNNIFPDVVKESKFLSMTFFGVIKEDYIISKIIFKNAMNAKYILQMKCLSLFLAKRPKMPLK